MGGKRPTRRAVRKADPLFAKTLKALCVSDLETSSGEVGQMQLVT